MRARTNRTHDVAAIELTHGKQIERGGEQADPGGAADGMKKQVGGMRVGLENGGDELEDQRHAKGDVGVGIEIQRGNNPGVEYTVSKRRQSKNETDERTRGADIEQRTGGANGRANHDESAEGADQRRGRNEKRIAGVDAVMAAGEVMPKFMSEENDKKRDRKGQPIEEKRGMKVGEAKGLEKSIEGRGLIVGIGGREMRAGNEGSI